MGGPSRIPVHDPRDAGLCDVVSLDTSIEIARQSLRDIGPFEAADLVRAERERSTEGTSES